MEMVQRQSPHNWVSTRERTHEPRGSELEFPLTVAKETKATLQAPVEFQNGGSEDGPGDPDEEEEQPRPLRPYKALVILFLFGGADTFNMLVPLDCELYTEYTQIRRTVALSPDQLDRVPTRGQPCADFGIHKALGVVTELYNAQDAAFVTNVGNLVEPILGNPEARRCPGGFSHNDMQHASQTLQCQYGANFKHGGGGRMADALATGESSFQVTSFSLAGKAAWSEGETTRRSVVSGNTVESEGGFNPPRDVQSIIDNLTKIEWTSRFAKEYIDQFGRSVNSFRAVSDALANGNRLLRRPNENYGALGSLQQVARLIAARQQRRAERDLFFVGLGGWDHHTGLEERLADRFMVVNQGVRAFVNEIKAQGLWNDVILATASDFARTLDPNANRGSDHAWAGQHMVLGGAVQGGRIYNEFPSLATGPRNPADVGRGRLIPKYPYESFLVPIARWLGVDNSQMDKVFPNLPNFNTSHIIQGML